LDVVSPLVVDATSEPQKVVTLKIGTGRNALKRCISLSFAYAQWATYALL
jgi:hypothetical protein